MQFEPWVRKIPWRRKEQPTPVFFPGNPMARGAWWATSTWDLKELDMTEQLAKIKSSLDNGKDKTPNEQANPTCIA